MPQASSSFDGTENPLSESGVWDEAALDVLQKLSGRVRPTVTGSTCGASRNSPSIHPDQFSQATFFYPNGALGSGSLNSLILARCAALDLSCYGYANGSDGANIYDEILEFSSSFGQTQLLFIGGAPATGDIARIEVEGATIRAYRNASLKGTVTDTTLSIGRPGLAIFVALAVGNCEMDDWSGGNLSEPGIRIDIQTVPMISTRY